MTKPLKKIDFCKRLMSYNKVDCPSRVLNIMALIGKGWAKLKQVIQGKTFDVAVDVRTDSPTFEKWVGEVLPDKIQRQFFIPEGFSHGCVF